MRGGKFGSVLYAGKGGSQSASQGGRIVTIGKSQRHNRKIKKKKKNNKNNPKKMKKNKKQKVKKIKKEKEKPNNCSKRWRRSIGRRDLERTPQDRQAHTTTQKY